jgi:hypothetical protein
VRVHQLHRDVEVVGAVSHFLLFATDAIVISIMVSFTTDEMGVDKPSPRRCENGSFRRIASLPFVACVAALETRLRDDGHDGELQVGRSRLRGPLMHDRDWGTGRIEVRLARGRLRRPLRMRLDVDRWSASPASTAFELTPCEPVRLAASYFRAGNLLLDALIDSLRLEGEAWRTVPPSDLPPLRSRGGSPTRRRG